MTHCWLCPGNTLGSTTKKLLPCFGRFWPLRGWVRGLTESTTKEKFMTKIFFSDNAEWWRFKNLWKMISADVKVGLIKTTINKRSSGCKYLTNIFKKYLQNLKYSVETAHIFLLWLVFCPSWYCPLRTDGGWRGGGGVP